MFLHVVEKKFYLPWLNPPIFGAIYPFSVFQLRGSIVKILMQHFE